ncbi:hypothetical protein Peur_026035 [Populus x canadensis]
MENDIEQARASNMEKDKASSPTKGKDFDVGSASEIEMAINLDYYKEKREMATNILAKLDSEDAAAIPFLDLATFHFGKYTFSQGVETSPSVKGSRHFTDLLRNLMLNGAIQRSYSLNPIMLKYSAVMLRKAGVKFRVTQDKCLVNITFDKGVMKIPRLEVDHCFERLVRNIMALEQCCNPFEAYVCSYIKFMNLLIDSSEDVALLVRKGIILNWLGEDAAVSNLINHFCENIDDSYTCFGDISQEVNSHYESRFNRMKATLKHVYFANIWRGTATVASAILLVLTLIQTIKSFL